VHVWSPRRRDPFHGQANIIEGTVLVASRILDGASNESRLGRKPDRPGHDFRRFAKPPFQIRRNLRIRRIDNQARVRQRFISRQPAVFSTKGRGGGALDVAKAGSQGPRECRRSRRPRDSELRRRQGRCGGHGSEFFLGDTHRSDLAIGSPLCYSLSHTDGLSQTLPQGQAIAAAESYRTASLVGRKICSSSFLPSRSLRSFVASSGFRPCWVRAKPRCRRPRPVGA